MRERRNVPCSNLACVNAQPFLFTRGEGCRSASDLLRCFAITDPHDTHFRSFYDRSFPFVVRLSAEEDALYDSEWVHAAQLLSIVLFGVSRPFVELCTRTTHFPRLQRTSRMLATRRRARRQRCAVCRATAACPRRACSSASASSLGRLLTASSSACRAARHASLYSPVAASLSYTYRAHATAELPVGVSSLIPHVPATVSIAILMSAASSIAILITPT